MAIDSQHPEYVINIDRWKLMRTCYLGTEAIKAQGTDLLPPTEGMDIDGMQSGQRGLEKYNAYKKRAVFHEFVGDAIETNIGLMHQQEASIELPEKIEAMRDNATADGESLQMLLRRINEEQLTTGRIGLMLDFPQEMSFDAMPFISIYRPESIINWDANSVNHSKESLQLVVLDETSIVRKDFMWETQKAYRVLQLGEFAINEVATTTAYMQGLFIKQEFDEAQMVTPVYRGATLDEIPFVFINSKDLLASPDKPPLLALAELSVSIYRSEADYRQNLHMQGQDTLVVIGEITTRNTYEQHSDNTPIRVGAGAAITLAAEPSADVKYIGVSSQGLAEQRQCLEQDKAKAEQMAGRLINPSTTLQESGVALNTRFAAQTATLNQIALAGAEGLQKILRIAAKWVGANPDEVIVKPNLEFSDFDIKGQEYAQLMSAKAMGAPLSNRSIHEVLVERGLTNMTYEDELAELEAEANMSVGVSVGANEEA